MWVNTELTLTTEFRKLLKDILRGLKKKKNLMEQEKNLFLFLQNISWTFWVLIYLAYLYYLCNFIVLSHHLENTPLQNDIIEKTLGTMKELKRNKEVQTVSTKYLMLNCNGGNNPAS